ncbi:MAG: hypothetical protein RIT27_1120 [Pseudomonadota bacterium]|jgi:transcriptional regulator with PAS, ATPase and Fis domain
MEENYLSSEQFQENGGLITQHSEMKNLLQMAKQIAPTNCNVLLTGESGTGKELLAKYLHRYSHRCEQPYLAINCGAFNEDLLVNELFGHEKGAFTGAYNYKSGLLETVEGGTLFLDEITEMSLSMQVKLLRLTQEREFFRLGNPQPIKANIRFIAATNRNIHQVIQEGIFRQDLYFRLNVVNLHLPPLSQRRSDIPLLADYFLQKHAVLMNKSVKILTSEALTLLKNYDFPGNVRELENIIERGVAISATDEIGIEQLPHHLRETNIKFLQRKNGHIPSLQEVEQEYIQWVLKETNGNQSLAAQIIGIDRVSLWRRLKKLTSVIASFNFYHILLNFQVVESLLI